MTGKAETGEFFAIANSPNRFSGPDLLETSVGDVASADCDNASLASFSQSLASDRDATDPVSFFCIQPRFAAPKPLPRPRLRLP